MKEKYLDYFEEMCPEDQEHVITICEMAAKEIYNRIKLRFDHPDIIDYPKLVASCFSKIFGAIQKKLKELESVKSDFTINLCDRLVIGFTTNENDDDEKVGNFMIFIRNLNSNKKNDEFDDATAKSKERAVQWNVENVIHQPKLIQEISIDAIDELDKIDIKLESSEFIMPIFITIYECLIKYLKIKRHEIDEFEFEINFISCFSIGAREAEDDGDDIYIRPNIESKLNMKDDEKASSKYE